ncbi:metallophosphoesterase [Croceiramulus getboli]|nr:metallophosphoesterase [Flavobacteriaceae bacterium YJPT1-3]
MKRRTFLKQTAATSALVGFGGLASSFAFKETFQPSYSKHITLLHTNDVHSHIEPFPTNDAQFPGQGGAAQRLTLIEAIRKENPNTLLLDAGDIFQGTPYFNFYGGELEFKLMSMMGYDAATLGNHDFDNGVDGLFAQTPHAQFDLITANYDFSNTIMDGKTIPHRVFEKDGVRIGVFGLGIQLEGLVNKRMYKETRYLDPVAIAQDQSRILKEEQRCDLVICLSHLGYHYQHDKIDDLKLAAATEYIDLIIGGHTHTFLPKPTVTKNRKGQNVLVNQVGWAGVNMGRVDFYFEEGSTASTKSTTIIV